MNTLPCKIYFDNVAAHWDERERIPVDRVRALVNMCRIKQGEKVLDIGCGTGVISGILMTKSGKVTAIDLSDKMLEIARKKHEDKGVEFVCGDFYDYSGEGFDCAVIYNAYPHFLDKYALCAALSRVLVSGGRAIIMHGMSRHELNHCHRGVMSISTILRSIEEESEFFTTDFELVASVDNDEIYFMRLIKK